MVDVYFVEAYEDLALREESFVTEDTVAVSVFDPFLKKGTFGKVVVIREKAGPVLAAEK